MFKGGSINSGVIVGGGSIGLRHYKNFKSLGIASLSIVEPDEERRQFLKSQGVDNLFKNLEESLAVHPVFAVVASPSHLHLEQALFFAKAKVNLFVEKPISHRPEGLNDLGKVADGNNLTTMVGCNMRFHPGPASVKQILEANEIGRVRFAQVTTGSYLPGWRPSQDYRNSYSAKSEMGGGCLLDCIHEIDLTRWYLGEVTDIYCRMGNLSELEIETEDYALLSCKHSTGSVSEVHLDYFQQSYDRGCRIVGDKGTITWSFHEPFTSIYRTQSKTWEKRSHVAGWEINQMYLDEARHFLDCVSKGKQSCFPFLEGIKVLQIALSAKLSSAKGGTVTVGGM